MQLRDYLHKNRIRKKEFCLLVRYSRGYLGRVCEYHKRPSVKFAEDVERVTKGEVTKKEMLAAKYENDE